MGNSLSSWGGRRQVAKIINKAGLPLQIDETGEGDQERELSRYTRAYIASGWFTGVKSTVTVPATPDVVYRSLSKDLHEVFTPMSECDDELREETKEGCQSIFRIVRIPFKVAFVTGNLKLRLNVEQNPVTRHILFESSQEGRLITKFVAHFHIEADQGNEARTVVELDAKIDAKSLPPAPFKNMVKDVMVSKMDSCMVDLVDYHQKAVEHQEAAAQSMTPGVAAPTAVPEAEDATNDAASNVSYESAGSLPDNAENSAGSSQTPERQYSRPLVIYESKPEQGAGILAAIRRSLSTTLPYRRSFELRRSMEKQRQIRQQRRSIERQRIQRISSASNLHGSPVSLEKPPLAPRAAATPSQVSVFAEWQAGQPVPDQW